MENLLKKADQIMNVRSEEKDREYGGFNDSISRAAAIASNMCDIHISPIVMTKCLIALKLGRLKYNLKDDTIMDAMAYLDGLQKVREENKLPFGYEGEEHGQLVKNIEERLCCDGSIKCPENYMAEDAVAFAFKGIVHEAKKYSEAAKVIITEDDLSYRFRSAVFETGMTIVELLNRINSAVRYE